MAIFSKSFVFTLIFSFGFFLSYNQVFSGFPSDIVAHISIAKQFMPGAEVTVSYPMWHVLVFGISELFGIDMEQGAVLITASIIVLLSIIIFRVVKYSLRNQLQDVSEDHQDYLYLGMTVVLMVATPVYVPFFNKYLLLGQAGCGVWHNVTLLVVKPFAILSIFLTVLYFETKRLKWMLVSAMAVILSIIAKPSFIVVYLPALYIFFVFFVLRQTNLPLLRILVNIPGVLKQYKQEVLYLLVLSLLSVLILLGQYHAVYGDGEEGEIVFDFLGVWSLYTPSVAGSLLLTYLFPAAVLFLVDKKDSNVYLLAVIMTIVSVLIFSSFAEEGVRYRHGNFGWGQQISVHILFIVSLIEVVKKFTYLKVWRKYILSVALSLHVVSGLFYLIKVSSGLYYG